MAHGKSIHWVSRREICGKGSTYAWKDGLWKSLRYPRRVWASGPSFGGVPGRDGGKEFKCSGDNCKSLDAVGQRSLSPVHVLGEPLLTNRWTAYLRLSRDLTRNTLIREIFSLINIWLNRSYPQILRSPMIASNTVERLRHWSILLLWIAPVHQSTLPTFDLMKTILGSRTAISGLSSCPGSQADPCRRSGGKFPVPLQMTRCFVYGEHSRLRYCKYSIISWPAVTCWLLLNWE